MRKLNLKSHLINTLPNIQGIKEVRQKLESSEFKEVDGIFQRETDLSEDLPIHHITQLIPPKEEVDLGLVGNKIKEYGLEGYMIPTGLLEEAMQHNPLPLSAQKQSLIEDVCRMNNGKHNEAEGINIIYERHHEAEPLFHPKINSLLKPNLPSQIVSVLHRHNSSRLTIGEAKSIYSVPKPYPYGEAILQLSHLRFHVLDIDLGLQVRPDAIGVNTPLGDNVSLFETCYSFPFTLKDNSYSDHGYVLYLKGKDITPEKIAKIVGLKKNGFGGVIIGSGVIEASVLSKKKKKFFKKNENHTFKHKFFRKENEAVGAYIYDPNLHLTQHGYCDLERTGQMQSINGEVVIAFFPFHQTFIAEYK